MAFDISDDSQAMTTACCSSPPRQATRGASSRSTRLECLRRGGLAGIVFGAALVGIIYLFAATLFPRRRSRSWRPAFVAFDGMSYVMSRIAMNDIFVAVFIVAGYAFFWQIWSGTLGTQRVVGAAAGRRPHRPRAATKWVGWYALIGLWVLVLARSTSADSCWWPESPS
jgi:dolichyl-phosphate-mannose--protein O-mannosyl transferase